MGKECHCCLVEISFLRRLYRFKDWKPLQSSDLEVRAIILLDITFSLGTFKLILPTYSYHLHKPLTLCNRESPWINNDSVGRSLFEGENKMMTFTPWQQIWRKIIGIHFFRYQYRQSESPTASNTPWCMNEDGGADGMLKTQTAWLVQHWSMEEGSGEGEAVRLSDNNLYSNFPRP